MNEDTLLVYNTRIDGNCFIEAYCLALRDMGHVISINNVREIVASTITEANIHEVYTSYMSNFKGMDEETAWEEMYSATDVTKMQAMVRSSTHFITTADMARLGSIHHLYPIIINSFYQGRPPTHV